MEEEEEEDHEEEELHSSKTRGIVFSSNGRHFGIKNKIVLVDLKVNNKISKEPDRIR